MFKKSLKCKLVVGALALVLMVSFASTVVVSIIVNRQNRAAVNVNLEKAMAVVRHDLKDREQKIVEEVNQMITANKIGGAVKFLSDFAKDDLTITNDSYTTIATALLNQLSASGMESIGVYDLNGRLQTFARKGEDTQRRFGFIHQETIHSRMVMADTALSNDEWTQSETIDDFDIASELAGSPPSSLLLEYVPVSDHIGVRLKVPLMGIDYNDNGDEVMKNYGTLVAVKLLDAAIARRLSELTGMSINLFVNDLFSEGDAPAYKTIDSGSFSRQETGPWNITAQSIRLGDIVIGQDQYFHAVLPVFGFDRYVGAVTVLQSDTIVRANNRQMIIILVAVALGCVVLIVPVTIVAAGKLVGKISSVATRLKDIAEGDGDLTKRLEVSSSDEISQLAVSFNAFIDNIHRIIQGVKKNSSQLNQSSVVLSEIAGLMDTNAAHTSERAEVVARTGNQMSTDIQSAATSMEQTAEKVQRIASSTNEMNETINEISKNTGDAREITAQAVDRSKSASQQVEKLGEAANQIGKVIDTITDISEQVNLLALNATIEAARAGDAGKGFAVVANEIKELAGQTAVATNEIKEKVKSIQSSTNGTIKEIDSISSVVGKVNDIVLIISHSVEEQSVTTANITENVNQAAEGIGNINQNVSESSSVASEIADDMGDVTQAAGKISTNSTQVNQKAVELSGLAEKLDVMVNQFKV